MLDAHIYYFVCPSICDTSDPCLKSSVYQNILCTTRYSDVSSFSRPNFAVHSSGLTPNEGVE